MAKSKKDIFPADTILLADLMKALAHPARIAIVQELARRNQCICGELVEVLPLAQSTVSQHLKALQKAGLVSGTIDGPRSCYCLNDAIFKKADEAITDFLQSIKKATSCC